MMVFELLSKRLEKEKKSGTVDVYQYEQIPANVLYQTSLILISVIGKYWIGHSNAFSVPENNNEAWDFIIKTIVRERGDPSFLRNGDAQQCCLKILDSESPLSDQLDLIDLAFQYVERVLSKRNEHKKQEHGAEIEAAEAIKELNYRFREGGVGYQFTGGQITRVDSQFVHAEIVVVALRLLNRPGFEGPESEFREAHAHYRSGNLREAVMSAGNAFESTMKAICEHKKWNFEKGAGASILIKTLRAKELFPNYLDNSFDQLIAVLKSGLPEVRNNAGSHGAGHQPLKVPQHVAAFAIHLAATKIVFLVECMNAK